MMKNKTLIVIAMLVLAGCRFEKTNDVSYYRENVAERDAMLLECQNNPGDMKERPNCINAREAKNRAVMNPSNTGMPGIK